MHTFEILLKRTVQFVLWGWAHAHDLPPSGPKCPFSLFTVSGQKSPSLVGYVLTAVYIIIVLKEYILKKPYKRAPSLSMHIPLWLRIARALNDLLLTGNRERKKSVHKRNGALLQVGVLNPFPPPRFSISFRTDCRVIYWYSSSSNASYTFSRSSSLPRATLRCCNDWIYANNPRAGTFVSGEFDGWLSIHIPRPPSLAVATTIWYLGWREGGHCPAEWGRAYGRQASVTWWPELCYQWAWADKHHGPLSRPSRPGRPWVVLAGSLDRLMLDERPDANLAIKQTLSMRII